ncbi:ATP-binding cassette subfamily G member 4 isoform X2 [Daktulosphaira vitifoliae]|uniref:ATP-binding cassette subfamily G member 4 isoform X2 n=1 Tax=Daktulosphaira vitifoliae TaxID=58002 RepID=UPI0021A9CCB0|nr:ATP-binding cassette subfamily G member 4 isoform X2 [Daktulosphaira vitifoliae]
MSQAYHTSPPAYKIILLGHKGVHGSLKVNSQVRNEKLFRKMSCYIMQEDKIQPMLTLNEIMMFAAELKLSNSTLTKEKQMIVSEIQSVLGLSEAKNTRTECLSGGQKKRLSIALELINNPPIIFLDEPTSGLDNVSTTYTIQLLHGLAHQGRTIVCTIHQPSASLFQLFDHVYVLSQGYCVYQGSTDQLVPFLSTVGLHCPLTYNPADFIIELTDGEEPQNISKLSAATNNGKICLYKMKKEKNGCYNLISGNFSELNGNISSTKLLPLPSINYKDISEEEKNSRTWCIDFPTSSWSQFLTLWKRMVLQLYRNKVGLNIQFYHHLVCGLAVGIVFFGMANDGTQFFNHMKFCMGNVLFHAFTQSMVQVLAFPSEVKLLKQEYFNRWYGLRPYYLALQLSKVPSIILFSQIYTTCVYFMSGLPLEGKRFLVFSVISLLVGFVSEGMGYLVASIFNVTNGSAVGPMIIAPFLGLAIYGFDFARQVPWIMDQIMQASFLRCGVIGLVLTVFGMGRKPLNCESEYCHFRNPKTLLYYLNLSRDDPLFEIIKLVIILLVFRVITYFTLRLRVKT